MRVEAGDSNIGLQCDDSRSLYFYSDYDFRSCPKTNLLKYFVPESKLQNSPKVDSEAGAHSSYASGDGIQPEEQSPQPQQPLKAEGEEPKLLNEFNSVDLKNKAQAEVKLESQPTKADSAPVEVAKEKIPVPVEGKIIDPLPQPKARYFATF